MRKLSWVVFCATRALARVFFPQPRLEGLENLPDGPCVIVGNHAQMYGPVYSELYLPGERVIWCNAEMMHLKEVPGYAFQDFWSKKPAASRWFYRLLSYAIAPLSVCVFNNAHCIGVYRDSRVMGTLRASNEALQRGSRVVIFPEHEVVHNPIVWEFQDGFISLARLYYKKTGKPLRFVPMYTAPKLKTVAFGPPVEYRPEAPWAGECQRICDELMDRVTEIARAMPRHRVVPYPNLPKKKHPWNIADEMPERK